MQHIRINLFLTFLTLSTIIQGQNIFNGRGESVKRVDAIDSVGRVKPLSPSNEDDNIVTGNRFDLLEERLKELARKDVKGLKQTIDFSVSGSTLQEFLRALAEAYDLNINVDPSLTFKLVNNFTNEKVLNVLLFICREYDLDIRLTGTIMSFYKHEKPAPAIIKPSPKDIYVLFNNYNEHLSIDLKNDTLDKVAKKITQVSKKNVVLAPGLANKLVSVYIENMPFDHAIEKLAYSNNLRFEKTKDNFYTLEPLESGPEPPASGAPNSTGFTNTRDAGNATRRSRNNSQNTETAAFEIVTDSAGKKRINLNAINQPTADLIKQVSKELQVNYFMFSEPKGNTTSKASKLTYEELLNYLLQGSEHTYRKEANIYLIGERALEGFRSTKVVQLQFRSAEVIIDHIPAELKKGVDIKYFKELNSLIMSGSAPQMREIANVVKDLDRVVPMIQIEVIIVNVTKTRSVSTGITAGFNDTIKSGGTILPGLNYTFSSQKINDILNGLSSSHILNLGKVNASFYVSLSALEKLNNADVQQTPKLSTLNGHEATLKIGQTRYYEIQTQNFTGSLTTNTIRTVQYQSAQANLSIKITPVVSGDDHITMDVDFENSGFIEIPATGPPPTQTSSFKSIVRIKNEEMIVLGGLESDEKSETGSGVPILSRIPILKWIFSSKTKSKTRRKQLIFIRPTVLY